MMDMDMEPGLFVFGHSLEHSNVHEYSDSVILGKK